MYIIKCFLGIIVCCCISYSVCNAQKFVYSYQSVNFNCKIKGETVCITGFDRNATNVRIPAVVEYKGYDYKVSKVDTYISGDNYLAETLVIENGITEIANFSFIEFRSLKSVTLPSSLKKIGKKTFAYSERINFINADVNGRVYVAQHNSQGKKQRDISNFLQDGVAQTVSYNSKNEKREQSARIELEKVGEAIGQNVIPEEIHADVDDVPILNNRNENSFALIIANEVYDYENNVDFALRDGRKFKEYCEKILGLPNKHIKLIENATYNQIRREMNWLKRIANAYANECKIYVYYAGHGMPDEKNGWAYLLPSDGYAADIAGSGYKMSDMYELLGELPAVSVAVFLDACFTGMKRDGQTILAARSVALLPEEESLSGNVMVFSATSETETAYSYKEQGHGLFTYYLLKKLKETHGNITYGELSKYLLREVSRKSLILNDKGQTPSVNISPNMEINWKKLNFGINKKNKKK